MHEGKRIMRCTSHKPIPYSCGIPKSGSRKHFKRGLLSVELLFVFPLLLLVVFTIIELGFLWSANLRVKAASQAACRVATLPTESMEEMKLAVERIAAQSLGSAKLARHSQVRVKAAEYSGGPVVVEVRLPMLAAAPDLLAVFGFQLDGRELVGRTVMRKE